MGLGHVTTFPFQKNEIVSILYVHSQQNYRKYPYTHRFKFCQHLKLSLFRYIKVPVAVFVWKTGLILNSLRKKVEIYLIKQHMINPEIKHVFHVSSIPFVKAIIVLSHAHLSLNLLDSCLVNAWKHFKHFQRLNDVIIRWRHGGNVWCHCFKKH